jgi:hypothetical protein
MMMHGLKNYEGFFDCKRMFEMGFNVGMQRSPIRMWVLRFSHTTTHFDGGGLGLYC